MQSSTQPKTSLLSSVRTQIVTVSVFAVVIAVLVTQFVTISTTRNEVRKDTNDDLAAIANASSIAIGNFLEEQIGLLQVLTNNRGLELRARQQTESYGGDAEEAQEQILAINTQWLTSTDNSPIVQGILNRDASSSLREFQVNFPGHIEVFATDAYGALIASTGRTSNYDQSEEEWWQRAWNNGRGTVYVDSRFRFDESASSSGLIIAVPIEDDNGVVGVLRTTYSFASIDALIDSSRFGETGHVALVNAQGGILTSPEFTGDEAFLEEFPELLVVGMDSEELAYMNDEQGRYSVVRFAPISAQGNFPILNTLGWYIVVFESEEEALTPINEAIEAVTIPILIIMGLLVVGSFLLARRITRPLTKMRQAAQQLISQRWDTRVDVRENNEMGELAYTFNTMAGQLQGFVDE
ncbi:MAG: HAMP domain-containing protein, partial [Anaerolineae bacterium]|nr:HAMP domain-containing protein [Anaerolineae bacterium]